MTYMLPSTWLCTKWNSANFHFITANLPLWYFDYSYPRNYKHFHFTALWVSCNHCALYLTCGIPDRLGSLQGNKTTGLQSFLNYHLWSIGAENFQKTQKACLSILNGGSYPISKVFRTNFCVIVINQEPILKRFGKQRCLVIKGSYLKILLRFLENNPFCGKEAWLLDYRFFEGSLTSAACMIHCAYLLNIQWTECSEPTSTTTFLSLIIISNLGDGLPAFSRPSVWVGGLTET